MQHHSFLIGCQHEFRPYERFCLYLASPTCLGTSATRISLYSFHCPSHIHLPAALRSTSITMLPRSYVGSDSWYCHPHYQVSLIHAPCLPAIPSPTTHCSLPLLYHATPQLDRLPSFSPQRSGLRHSLAGSPLQQAVSSLLSYGLAFHLPLLPTTPHGVAVTVDYRAESVFPEGDFHPSGIAHFQAH